MKLRSILVDWLLLCLNLNWIKLLLVILCLRHHTLRLSVSLLPNINRLWLLALIYTYTVSIAESLMFISHHWISIGRELFLHIARHIQSILKLLLELHLFHLSLVVHLPDFILKWLYFPLIILFNLIRSLSFFLNNCFISWHVLFKLRILSFSRLEYTLHLNVRSFMFPKSSF